MIIHMETQVTCLFGVLDDAGNVVQRLVAKAEQGKPDPFQIQVLTPEAFQNAYKVIVETRDSLIKQEAEAKNKKPDDVTELLEANEALENGKKGKK